MRAHGQRRIIWIANVVLGACLLGLAAWYVLDVRKAVGDPSYLKPGFADAAIEAFQAQPAATQSALKPPVTLKELEEIDRPEFKQGNRRWWWLYSGPRPPAPPAEEKVEGPKLPVISDLEKLGQPRMLIYMEPTGGEDIARGSVLQWEFNGGKDIEEFHPGEFIVPPGKKVGSIKFVNVVPKAGNIYEIVYEVYTDPDAPPVSEGRYEWVGVAELDEDILGRIRITPVVHAAAAGEGEGREGAAEAIADAGSKTEVVADAGTSTKPGESEEPGIEDLKPKIQWDNPGSARIEFDDKTVEYFRGKSAESVAKTLKTQVARDKNGKVLGLQITGLGAQSPAQKFDVRPGDILVSINGKPVSSRSDAVSLIQAMDPGIARVTVVIDRLGRKITYVIDPRDNQTRRNARYLNDRR
ncbi:MAG: PDZ domain-containing protein [Planctomycetota bacterium]